MILLVAIGLLVFARVARVQHWPGADTAARRWTAIRPTAVAYVRSSPATFLYLFVLVVTTWVLLGLTSDVVRAVLSEHSSNLTQLRANPVRVLIRSAFWVDSYQLLVWAVLFAAVLAPAERWLGTARWLVVFAVGHVGATLATAAGIWLAIRSGIASTSLVGVIDVGVSYGFVAVAAIFTYRLPAPARWLWAGSLLLVTAGAAVAAHTFTDFGHLAAVLIGFSLYPLTRTVAVLDRGQGPIWRPLPSG